MVLAALFAHTDATAQGRLSAQVYLTQSRIPNSLNLRRLIGFAKRHRARRLTETSDSPLAKRKWLATLITVFNRPVGDLEFQVLFYDVEGGGRRFVEPLSVFVNDREEKTFVQKIKLPRPRFKPNRKMELVVTVRRQEVGRQKFELVGENVRHSGEVNFSVDDTRRR